MGEPAIVLVTSSFPVSGDGSEAAGTFVSDLVVEMSKSVPVRVVAPGMREAIEHLSPAVVVHRFEAPRQALSQLKPFLPVDALRILRVLRDGFRATDEAVAAGPVMHVLALWALPCGAWAKSASLKAGVPYSIWTLGSDIWTLGRIPLVRAYLRKVLAGAKYCFSDGMQLLADTERIGGRKVGFLPSTRAVSRRRVGPLRDKPPFRLVFLGRWHHNKGVDILIDALGKLSNGDWSRIESVDIFGGGPLEPLVRDGVKGLREQSKPVQAHGYVDKQEAEALIATADFLVIPSRVESIPVVFSDAMKLRCPVIAMPVGDFPALMKEGPPFGVLSSNVSVLSLRQAIREALVSSPVDFEQGIAEMASRFDLAATARELVQTLSGEKSRFVVRQAGESARGE